MEQRRLMTSQTLGQSPNTTLISSEGCPWANSYTHTHTHTHTKPHTHHLIQPPLRAAGRSALMFMVSLNLQITVVTAGRIYDRDPVCRPLDKPWITPTHMRTCTHSILRMIQMLRQHKEGFFLSCFVARRPSHVKWSNLRVRASRCAVAALLKRSIQSHLSGLWDVKKKTVNHSHCQI